MSQPGQAPGAPGGVVSIEHKKGEVNELKTQLRNPNLDRDPDKKREVIKRVIAYMTLGIDVSKLFSEMIMVRLALPALLGLMWWPVPCPQSACAAHGLTLTDGEPYPGPRLTAALPVLSDRRWRPRTTW